MVKYFKDNPTIATRGLQIWQILIAKASNRQTLTYKELAAILGCGAACAVSQFLDPVYYFCCQYQLPPLTTLVVSQSTVIPGDGAITSDPSADREKVFGFDWFAIYPPSPKELESIRRQHKLSSHAKLTPEDSPSGQLRLLM